jgi:glycine reductase complex component B subunit gamma
MLKKQTMRDHAVAESGSVQHPLSGFEVRAVEHKKFRVVHYVNQFFGGMGGEDKAGIRPKVIEGTTGPGRAIQAALAGKGEVVASVICGDDYFAENMEAATAEILDMVRPHRPDVLIAGPAFEAGRYGVACGAIGKAASEKFGIPAVSGMFEENPGVDLFHKDVFIVRTGNSVRTMNDAVARMVSLALKLASGQPIGKPPDEGYFPRGIIVNETSDRTGAERVVTMLLDKLQGRPFVSEVSQPRYDRIRPAAPVKDITSAKIALVTDGGLVPRGNPDRIESSAATHFGKYRIEGLQRLEAKDFEVSHGGYDSVFIRQDPNRLVPLDVMRDLEREKAFGKLHDSYYVTTGVATTVENAKRMGRAIASELKEAGVDGVILTST